MMYFTFICIRFFTHQYPPFFDYDSDIYNVDTDNPETGFRREWDEYKERLAGHGLKLQVQ